jgi:hypothetical protein
VIGNVHPDAYEAEKYPFYSQGRLHADAIDEKLKTINAKGSVKHLDRRSSIVLFSEMEDALLWDLMYS